MAKGQEKQGRDKKKPKQKESTRTAPKSAYAQSMSNKGPAPAFGAKK